MAERKNVKIIAFVGLSGTGRSAASTYVSEQGIPRVSFADIVMQALRESGLEPTPENEISVREKLRLDPAGDLVLKEIILQLDNLTDSGQRKIVLDGLGGWESYKRLKHEFPGSITVVALTAQRHLRLRRLATRAENPLTEQQANQRDYDEIETLNKGGIIAVADYYLSDNGSLENLHASVDELLRDIEF